MVETQLVARGLARYSLGYGGATVLAVGLLRSPFLLLGLVVVGLLVLLFVAGGTGTVRMGTAMSNADAAGIDSGVRDPYEDEQFSEAIEADLKLTFYAVGLLVLGFAGMIVLGI